MDVMRWLKEISEVKALYGGLNPCFNGCYALIWGPKFNEDKHFPVLILVLMDVMRWF